MSTLFSTLINKLTLATNSVAKVSNAVGTLVVLALVLVVDFDVIARGLFNKPFMGAVEVVQFSMVLIVFLQLPDVVRVNRLTRSDGFLTVLAPKYPKAARIMRRIIDAVSMIFMALIAVAIWPEFIEMLETKDYFGVPGIFKAPWWPIKLTIFLSASLCAIIFALKVINAAREYELVRMNEMKDKSDDTGVDS